MSPSDVLAAALATLTACNKCALCQEVCPALAATTMEADGARGHNQLIRLLATGRLGPEHLSDLREHLATCLLCGACSAACPSGVATDQLVVAARAEIAAARGHNPLLAALLHQVLVSPGRLAGLAAPLRLYEHSGLRSLLTGGGSRSLPGRLGELETMLPRVPAEPFPHGLERRNAEARRVASWWRTTHSYGQDERSSDKPALRVAYFAGCLTSAMFAGVAGAVCGVLIVNGYDVTVPEVSCCGAAHEAYGDREFLLALARRNIDAIDATGAEAVVTDCATCAHTLVKYAELLRDDPAYAARAAALAGRVQEICQFLVHRGFHRPAEVRGINSGAPRQEVPAGEEPQAPPARVVVTYHDPCHLARGLSVRDEPRAILRSIPGVELVELPEPEVCCGGAGSFAVSQPAIAGQILRRKIAGFQATGASLLATTCPSCLLQLGTGLRAAGRTEPPVHPCELLWRAYAEPTLRGAVTP